MTWSAPSSAAYWSFSSVLAVAYTSAPAWAAIWTAACPTPPLAPSTSTDSPGETSALVFSIRHAVWKTSGAAAAVSQSTWSGTGTRLSAGTAAYSLCTPGTCSPMTWNEVHSGYSPFRQNSQVPQETPADSATRSPAENLETSSPTSATTPAPSLPGT